MTYIAMRLQAVLNEVLKSFKAYLWSLWILSEIRYYHASNVENGYIAGLVS